MKPTDFLVTAEFLIDFDPADLSNEPTEADFRTAVGRAYYASFLDVRDLLEGMGFKNLRRGNTTHHLVKQYLEHGGKRARRISNKLSGLHERRKNADYDIPMLPTFFLADAERAISRANEITAFIDDCHKDPALKKSVESAIRAQIHNP